ncbi:LD-carboxypeptidase [Ornithinimicrobium sp. F0845]|uniref:S66 family peptidase n=1 Tax=Ornithinimicrobium sp. F0845 TaxID=2926412 RepID=UPI001FF2A3DA|nr:S66 peptidase family protein [Ornithinimicrobium sp. F0845]MCK0112043.1 LD-carboxypeptidase [Ornithinimicrobium sp. F0845]
MLRFPAPLQPGDRIGVTSPSSGVPAALRPRLEFAVGWLRDRGYDVVVGECMDGDDSHVSAPAVERADELQRMLTDPGIRAVVPPWGGETGIDLVDLLDWDLIAEAEPTWLVGFSDLSTLLVPLTVRAGWASLHGANLMDTPYAAAPGLAHWTDLASATGPVRQEQSGVYRTGAFDDWEADPGPTTYSLEGRGAWEVADDDEVEVSGRLIGGCLETVANLAGTPCGDVPGFGRQYAEEGLIVYLEAAEAPAWEVCRRLHGLRLAGWFGHANAILIGRTEAPASGEFTQREAVLDALGDLDVPIVFDVECGHVPPYLPLVNGALAHLTATDNERSIVQELGK